MGRREEALAQIRRAAELDPLSPIVVANLGAILTNNRRYDESLDQLRKALILNPKSGIAEVHVAVALLAQRKFADAIAALDRASALMPGARVVAGLRGYTYAMTGKRQEALDVLKQMNEARSGVATGLDFPIVYVGLGDKDHAFEALDRAVSERAMLIDVIKADPLFEPLHSDPRFAALLRRMNLQN
jgi:tetratricopeptide (TPR) repeat protein